MSTSPGSVPRTVFGEATVTIPGVDVVDNTVFYTAAKRLLDLVVASVAIVLFSVPMLLIAVAIKLTSQGPVIYRQLRVGRGGKIFTFYKFRSMVDGADKMQNYVQHLNTTNGPTFKAPEDPRVTRVGRFLRRTSLDELPQLFNVLRGDMSLVGPRPPLPSEVEAYEAHERRRLSVIPGITCLWQINGRSNLTFADQVKLDLEYIENRSLWLDLLILLKTIPAVLTCRGAC